MSKTPRPTRLSDAEWTVMQIVWQRGTVTARDVVDALVTVEGWAYTTVKTLMSRLVGKGALREEMRGNQAVYEPLVDEKSARRSAVRSLADRAFGGSLVPMVGFLLDDGSLSAEDRERLREILDRKDGEERP